MLAPRVRAHASARVPFPSVRVLVYTYVCVCGWAVTRGMTARRARVFALCGVRQRERERTDFGVIARLLSFFFKWQRCSVSVCAVGRRDPERERVGELD